MKKLIPILLLVGCERPASLEDVEPARVYCEKHGATLLVNADSFNQVINLECNKDGVLFSIPGDSLKKLKEN